LELATENVEEGWSLTTAKQGISYFGSGVGGSIIGYGASLLSIIDDSVKNEEEALSENAMDKKWGWYGSAVNSREESGCKKLFIGTRWSTTDIVGRLKETGIFGREKNHDITIPAIINGKSFSEKIHSTEKLMDTRRITSEMIWLAEWMQEPVEKKGRVFPADVLQTYAAADLNDNPDGYVMVADIADEGADSLCVLVGAVFGQIVYVVDVIFSKEPTHITQPRVANMIDEYTPDKIVFEANNMGKEYARGVNNLVECGKNAAWKRTTKNKETRILLKEGVIKENFRFLREKDRHKEYIMYMRELGTYNREGGNKHDDAADATTMLAENTQRRKTNRGRRGIY
jgi:predicted phage terminase large subunit-like protein